MSRFGRILLLTVSVSLAAFGALPASAAGTIAVGPAQHVPHAALIKSLSCPRGTPVDQSTCELAITPIDGEDDLSVVTNGTPTKSLSVLPGGDHITCVTATVCVTLGNASVNFVSGNQTLGVARVYGMDPVNAISCQSVKYCVVVGTKTKRLTPNGAISVGEIAFPIPGANPVNAIKVAGASALNDVSCIRTTCFAVGQTGVGAKSQAVIVTIHNGHVGAVRKAGHHLTSLTGLSCGSATRCLAMGSSVGGNAPAQQLVNISAGKAVSFRANPGLRTFSCWTGPDCLGLSLGVPASVTELHLGSVVATQEVPAYPLLTAVSCPTGSACLVAGQNVKGTARGVLVVTL